MTNPKKQSALSDIQVPFAGQGALPDHHFGLSMKKLLSDRDMVWLSRQTGISTSTLSDIGRGKTPRADNAVKIARALRSSVEVMLLNGDSPERGLLTAVDDIDWVWIARFDLRDVRDEGKGPAIDSAPFRKEWLAHTLGTASELWLAAVLSDYAELDLLEGDLIFCRNAAPGDLLDGQVILFRLGKGLKVARYRVSADTSAESVVTSRDVAPDGYVPVARILGKLMKRF